MRQKPIEINLNKTRAWLISALILACIVFVVLVAIYPELFVTKSYVMQGKVNFMRFASPVFIVVLAYGLYFVMRPLFQVGPAITLTDSELKLASLPKGFQLKWEMIADVHVAYQQNVAFLVIVLKEPTTYKQCLGWYGRYTNDWNIKKFGGSIVISTVSYTMKPDELIETMMIAFEASKGKILGSKEWWTN